MFSSSHFIISGLALNLIHFKVFFFFVYIVRTYSNFLFFFTCNCSVFPAPHVENNLFLLFCHISIDYVCGIISELSILFHLSMSVCCQYRTILITIALQYNLKMVVWSIQFCSFISGILWNSGSIVVPYKFNDYFFYFLEKCHGYFDRDCIHLQIGWNSMDILIILNDSNSRTKYTFSSMFYLLFPSSIFYSFQSIGF